MPSCYAAVTSTNVQSCQQEHEAQTLRIKLSILQSNFRTHFKWEKFVSCFRWWIHHPIGKYIVTKNVFCQQFANTNSNTWNVRMGIILWYSVFIGRLENMVTFSLYQSILAKHYKQNSYIPIYSQSTLWYSQWMWTIWWVNWQIVKISATCTQFVLPSTYPRSNIPHKLLSTIHNISQNCRTSHLKPLTVNAIQTVTQSVQSVSARLLIYCELLYRQRGTRTRCYLPSWTFVHAYQIHSVNTEHSEAQ